MIWKIVGAAVTLAVLVVIDCHLQDLLKEEVRS